MGAAALILLLLLLFCCCCRLLRCWPFGGHRGGGGGLDASRGRYRRVLANEYTAEGYDDAFDDGLSDYDDEDEVLDDGDDDDDYYSGSNGHHRATIELKDLERDRGQLSLREMNG